ncbi:MAG: adenosylmethionine--8-amino-7-oxononanoate transaminase [Polyangiaceae bacterium]
MSSEHSREELLRLDHAHVWHPYAAIEDIEKRPPLVIKSARGSILEDHNGTKYLDGNSSWYVASLGHGHPRLVRTIAEQAQKLAHVSLAGVTHENAVLLAQELVAISPAGLKHVFYTDNGSGSIEVALRMTSQAWAQMGQPKKNRFIAIDGAYHGDTLGAASLGGIDVFTRKFAGLALECLRVPFPEENAYGRAFEAMIELLHREKESIAAVIVEPIIQGVAGMRTYDPRYLRDLRAACDACDIFLVVDEVFSGYGRTAKMWATEHAGISPDVMCLGKVFSSLVPMGATIANDRIFSAFRGGRANALHYGHTFCGNPIGAALAREVLAIFRDEKIVEGVVAKSEIVARAFARIAKQDGVERVRTIGMIGAADLTPTNERSYLDDRGWRVYDEAIKRGAYLRPLGSTVYMTPPLTMLESELEELCAILEASIKASL